MVKLFIEESKPEDDASCLPAGWYPVTITAEQIKQNNKGTGEYLQLDLQVISGPYAGRYYWERLSLWHENPTAVEIATKTLKQIGRAIGIVGEIDSAAFVGRQLDVKLVVKDNPEYGLQNDAKGYRALQGPGTVTAVPATATAAPEQKTTPW